MKTIGKIAVLAMTLSLAFVLTACGGSSSSSAASSSASASASAASSAAASSESASASAASASASASSEAANLDTYENEFFGIKFHLPEGWTFESADTIKGFNELISAASQGAELDMVATNADSSQVVLVSIEQPNDKNAGKTAEQYLEAQEQETKDSLQGNVAYTSTSVTMTFSGLDRELPATLTDLDINGVKICMCEAVAEKDGYFLSMIAMGATEDEVTKAFESFAAITA